eukprot:TRINITY_DN10081_c0_g1_i1.p1 TRINITY_DN10081_c0_g1~~TRINITY_DN10081_c0_g1_i1.p1  ORF type:complete len:575 (+),score=235.23 TRINITY_DN10081_c0_g1_i1:152-1876(+)
MISIASVLPPPRQGVLAPRDEDVGTHFRPPSQQLVTRQKYIPPYGRRSGWVPRADDDFADGGAFPEIHVAQYPLGMGRKDVGIAPKTVPVTVDADGRVNYDAIVNPHQKANVQSRHTDLAIKKFEDDDLRRPDAESEAETTERTRKALEAAGSGRIAAAQPHAAVHKATNEPTYVRYTPAQGGGAFNSGAKTRIIRMSEMPTDPMEPPKFRHKKVPRGPPSPPVPVMHSPPRKVTIKDQQDWKIPPCISNWKNSKGYVIPLDKRLAADGRGLQEQHINDNFAKLSESLYIAERNAREEVSKRAEIDKRLKLKEKEKKEELLRKLAQEARMQRNVDHVEADAEDEESLRQRAERDKLRAERTRERERDLRMERNKSAATRNADRDIGERIALGQTVPTASSETMYDQRLFNQSQGLDSGFGEGDSYNVYTKPLFGGSAANVVYKPKKLDESETYGSEADLKKLHDTSKFRPDKGFAGTERSGDDRTDGRKAPVEFERDEIAADPFGLDEFLQSAKGSSGKALDKIGSGGQMHAASSSSYADTASASGSKRSRIDFDDNSGRSSSSSSKRHHRDRD